MSQVVNDMISAAFTAGVILSVLRFWEEMAKRGVFDPMVNRKLVHISSGLVFILCWPLFSSERQAPYLAAIVVVLHVITMLLIGLGLWKNEAMVKSMSRYGDYRELLKGPFYYACALTLSTIVFWRTSPISVTITCNLCAGDGFADIFGRRFGRLKLPYNPNKSFAGSMAMACAGFIASLWYMFYFSLFGYIVASWRLVLGFLVASVVSAVVESLPISTDLDDNLTVPLASFLVGSLVF